MFGRGFAYGPGAGGERFSGYGRMGGGFARHGFPMGGAVGAIFALLVIAMVVFVFWQLFKKAGYHGALSLLMVIPVVNIGMLLFLALSEWPAHKELAAWRTWYASTQMPAVPVAGAVAQPVTVPVAETVVAAAPAEPTAPATPEPPVTGNAAK